jgi:hypothetical protein
MSFYNPPTYFFGSTNPVFNASDYETQSTTTITESDADKRYVKLSGGIMTGSLTSPDISVSSSLTVPSITLSSNSISQTSNQVGYINVKSISASTSNSGSLFNVASFTSLPVGVYILSCSFSLNSSTSMTILKIYRGFSSTNNSFSNTNLEITESSTTDTVNSVTYIYKSNCFIYQQSSTSNLYFNMLLVYSNSSATVNVAGQLQALRIA